MVETQNLRSPFEKIEHQVARQHYEENKTVSAQGNEVTNPTNRDPFLNFRMCVHDSLKQPRSQQLYL
jgi:hypothetical protein